MFSAFRTFGALGSQRGVFDVVSLFRAGEQGVWYDPSDLSTLFQDSAGTTPVTASGQPVGLMLDKSKGLVLGPELVVNGDFSNGTTGFTPVGIGTLSVVSGRLECNSGSTINVMFRTYIDTTPGVAYFISIDIVALNSGSALRFDGGVVCIGESYKTDLGTRKAWFIAASSSTPVELAGQDAYSTCTIDNISVRELPGVHGVQATAGMRPLYQSPPSRVVYDQVDDKIVATFASSLGSNVTIARAIPGVGAQILTGQAVGTSYTDNVNSAALIIVDRTLTGAETSALTAYLNNKAGL